MDTLISRVEKRHIRQDSVLLYLRIALAVSIILGFFIRISGVGNAPLAVDEYFIVKSVENILKHGFPQFETGGYYTRGILYQYVLAFISFLWGAKVEVSYRVVTILFNLLAIPAILKSGKKVAGSVVGYMVAILFCFSLWEIEFARFIRMYAPFQTLFLWYVLFLYNAIIEEKWEYLKWAFLLSFVGIFVYEGGVFLLVLNFLPFLLNKKAVKKSYLPVAAFLLILQIVYILIDFRRLGAGNYLPSDVTMGSETAGPILFPLLLIQSLPSNGLWFVLFLLPIGFSGFVVYRLFKNETVVKTTKLSLIFLIVLSLLNLFGLLIALFVLFILFRWISSRDFKWGKLSGFVGAVSVNFLFWLIYVFASDGWSVFFTDTQIYPIKYSVLSQLQLYDINQIVSHFSLKKAIFLFFNYPHFYNIIVKQFLKSIPIYFAISAIFFIGYLILFLIEKYRSDGKNHSAEAFVVSIVLLMAIGISTVNVPYNTTRYSFFFYPLVVLIIIHSMYRISFRVFGKKQFAFSLFGIMLVGFVVLIEDYDFNHLMHSGSKETYLRMNYPKSLREHYYSRHDVISPAEVVNAHLKDGDIVITSIHPIEYYLKKLDYFYIDFKKSKRFPILSSQSGTRELWTNANLIYHGKDMFELVNNSPADVWLIIESPEYHGDSIEAHVAVMYQDDLFHKSFDKKINVFRIKQNDNK